MKALARGFLAGFGFALGASVAGTLIGYTIGRIGEASVKRLLSPERTSSPAPSSSQPSSEPLDSDDRNPMTMAEAVAYRVSNDDHDFVPGPQGCNYEPAPGTVCGYPPAEHKSHYGAREGGADLAEVRCSPGWHVGCDHDPDRAPTANCEIHGDACAGDPVRHNADSVAPFHTCEIGVPDADHPLRTDSAHCLGCPPQCDLFPGQTCTAVPQKCRTFCERR